MQRSERSFIKNGKEPKDRKVLLKRTDAQPCLQGVQALAKLRIQRFCNGRFNEKPFIIKKDTSISGRILRIGFGKVTNTTVSQRPFP